jgi:hypothetical protein
MNLRLNKTKVDEMNEVFASRERNKIANGNGKPDER